MKNYIALSLLMVLSFLSSCQKEQVDPTPANALSPTAQQTKARLTAPAKWAIDEMYAEGKLLYKRGQTNPADVDLEVEWCRFAENGNFETKYFGDPAIDVMYYKIDEAKSRVIIGYDAAFKQTEDWTIKTGSVSSDTFDIEFKEGSETGLLKMVAIR